MSTNSGYKIVRSVGHLECWLRFDFIQNFPFLIIRLNKSCNVETGMQIYIY